MKIGIGVTTYNRPEHFKLWVEQIRKFKPAEGCEGFVISDECKREKRMGVAFSKNANLTMLKDCDYIFLFDDDCFPIKEGWAYYFINAHKASGQHHFMYLRETPTIKKIGENNLVENQETQFIDSMKVRISASIKYIINEYNNCAGCMMFLTKEVIEKVGAYGDYTNIYGMEHAGYTERIHKAGLTSIGKYLCPSGADEYIYSLDLQNNLPFNKQLNHQPSMANEINKIPEYIKAGHICYQEDIQTIYKPL